MTGLAATLSSPALIHALRGNLHNVALLTELLQREAASMQDPEALRASAQKRATTIRAEIAGMQDRIRMLESLSGGTDAREASVRDLSAALEEALTLARVEAARRMVTLSTKILAGPVPIICAPQAFDQAMLTCAMYSIGRCAEGATMGVTAMREGDEASVTFVTSALVSNAKDDEHVVMLDLIAALASLAGARFSALPAIRIAFMTVAQ